MDTRTATACSTATEAKNTAVTDHHEQQADVKCLFSPQNSFSVEQGNKKTPLCPADAVNNKNALKMRNITKQQILYLL